MPAIPPKAIVGALLDAFNQSGAEAVLSSKLVAQPRTFVVTSAAEVESIWVYIWTLTPGGRPDLPNEFRIQMSSAKSPLTLNPDGGTVLLGYEPALKMFAGFDLHRHRFFSSRSPSVQIDIRTVRAALDDGLAFDRKDNDEVAIGIRPDEVFAYVRNSEALHELGPQAKTFKLLEKARSLDPLPKAQMSQLTPERRRIVETVRRLARAANFRDQVLTAYGNRCAVTRMQLKVVEAAHILPVAAVGSPDHVSNGLALSATYHRAFDAGLIYLERVMHSRQRGASA